MKQKKSLAYWKCLKAEQISTRILYTLMGVTTVLFVLFFVQRFLPRLFDNRIFYGLAFALPIALAVFSRNSFF